MRVRPCGVRAELYPGCLRVSKSQVEAIEHAGHLYYVPPEYREVHRLAECPIYATAMQVSPEAPTFDRRQGLESPIAALIGATNAALTPERLGRIAEDVAETDPEERKAQILGRFLANQVPEINRPRQSWEAGAD